MMTIAVARQLAMAFPGCRLTHMPHVISEAEHQHTITVRHKDGSTSILCGECCDNAKDAELSAIKCALESVVGEVRNAEADTRQLELLRTAAGEAERLCQDAKTLAAAWEEEAVRKRIQAAETQRSLQAVQALGVPADTGLVLGKGRVFDVLSEEMGRWGKMAGVSKHTPQGRWLYREIPRWGGATWPDLRDRFVQQMDSWLQGRHLSKQWLRDPRRDSEENQAVYYLFSRPVEPWSTERMSRSVQAYAGTFTQSIWATSAAGGRLMESSHKSGHGGECTKAGFYCTPVFGYAGFYSWAVNMFNDGLMHGATYDVVVDSSSLHAHNQHNIGQHNHEYIMKEQDVWLRGMWTLVDRAVKEGDPRFYKWKTELELLPPNCTRPANPAGPCLRSFASPK